MHLGAMEAAGPRVVEFRVPSMSCATSQAYAFASR